MKRKVKTHSQHFLRNPRFIAELVGHSNIRRSDTVVDIGAGSGAITAVLARRSKRVIAYENEREAFIKLQRNMSRYDNVEIIEKDFLRESLPREPYKVFANIPFSLSSKIIRKLTEADVSQQPKAIYVIVQKQFAQKITPSDCHFTSQLGAQLMPWWKARIRRPLRKTDFTPPPAVDTVLLELKPLETPLLPIAEAELYRAFIEQSFASSSFFTATNRAAAQVSPERKPSELTVEQWVALYKSSMRA